MNDKNTPVHAPKRDLKPSDKLKNILKAESIKEQLQNALGENKDIFIASLVELYTSDNYLQKCEPSAVIVEALKAATLKLPINKSLGFAWIIPRKSYNTFTPHLQLGYKGIIQLAQRTGQYKYINADEIFEGELISINKLTGEVDLTGDQSGPEIVGYFAYIETISGFKKTLYRSKPEIIARATKYSDSYKALLKALREGKDPKNNAWHTSFDEMAKKTILSELISKYGPMTIEFASAVSHEFEYENGDMTYQEEDGSHYDAQALNEALEAQKPGNNTGKIIEGEIMEEETKDAVSPVNDEG